MLFRFNVKDTLFKGIKSLEPGHYLTYTYNYGLKDKEYFNVNEFSRNEYLSKSFKTCETELENWLDESVQRQLMSDVKLGCQLSGGIDSSLVTYFANNNSSKGQFESVSVVFNDHRFSEERYIDRVNNQLNIEGHKFILDSSYYLQNIEKATWHFEAPINHRNTIGIYLLSQSAKKFVTVLLSGEGADEVFGGYSRYYDIAYPFLNKKLLSEIKKNLASPHKLMAYFNPINRAIMATAFMEPNVAKQILPSFNSTHAIKSRKALYKKLSGTAFDKQVKYEIQTYLPELLIRQDKMSMAHSIENRVPFLDNEIVANSFTIPSKYLLMRKSDEGYNTEKYLLKKIAESKFDRDFSFRNKMGFGIPVKEYFKNVAFQQYLNDKILPSIKQRGIMNSTLIAKWIANIPTLNFREMESLWITITFEIWASIYLDLKHENWNTSN